MTTKTKVTEGEQRKRQELETKIRNFNVRNAAGELTEDDEREWARTLDEHDELVKRMVSATPLAERSTEMLDWLAGAPVERATTVIDGGEIRAGAGAGTGEARFGQPLGDLRMRDLPGYGGTDADIREQTEAFFRATATGDMRTLGDLDVRAMGAGTGSAGGYTVPDLTSSFVWDLARPKLVLQEAGAQFVPYDDGARGQTVLPVQLTDFAPELVDEHAPVPEDAIVFGAKLVNPFTIAVAARASIQLIEDSATNVGAKVAESFAKGFAQALDYYAIFGEGGPGEPLGLVNASSASTVFTSSSLTYDNLVSDVTTLREAHENPTATIVSPRSEKQLAVLKADTDGQYLTPPPFLNSVKRLWTSQIPSNLTVEGNTNVSYVITGDYTQSVVAVRAPLTVLTLRERYADQLQVGWVAYARFDTAIMREPAFLIRTAGTH
jgi:HK97 family phage major capsid protein